MEDTTDNESQTQDGLVNYMPGMPMLSSEPGRFERFVANLLRRRGSLRPVASDE